MKAPKGWIFDHTAKERHDPISIFLNPHGPEVSVETDKTIFSLPSPMPFEPQPVPYLVEMPSELVESALCPGEVAKSDADRYHAVIRGTVTHRLIESLWHTGQLPGTERIATALATEGMNPGRAATVALEIEGELRACQDEDFFSWLLHRSDPCGESEWAMEALRRPGVVQMGILDFVRQDRDLWWIVDFKTSRPEAHQGEADFLKQEAERYRLQLKAYRDILARAKGIDPARIRGGLYFTGIQKWYAVTRDK